MCVRFTTKIHATWLSLFNPSLFTLSSMRLLNHQIHQLDPHSFLRDNLRRFLLFDVRQLVLKISNGDPNNRRGPICCRNPEILPSADFRFVLIHLEVDRDDFKITSNRAFYPKNRIFPKTHLNPSKTHAHWLFSLSFRVTLISVVVWYFQKKKKTHTHRHPHTLTIAITLQTSLILSVLSQMSDDSIEIFATAKNEHFKPVWLSNQKFRKMYHFLWFRLTFAFANVAKD